ncbi:MAG: HEAT repeat domain-containing protein [Vicinamibacterales bacterium]
MRGRSCARVALVALTLLAAACAGAPPPTTTPEVRPFEEKMRWILQLEDERRLRVPAPDPPAAAPPTRGRRQPAPSPAPPRPDLTTLLSDAESRVRRRAALAVGRVRMSEGIDPLLPLLATDGEPEVRQMAAFALGLIGDPRASDALSAALADADPLVQGRAAEALGLIGHRPGAPAVATMMQQHVAAGALGGIEPDDLAYPKTAATEAVRLGTFALVRLAAYDQLASTLLDASGAPISRWWPVAFAFQRIGDAKAVPVLLRLLEGEGQMARAFAARGLGSLKEQSAVGSLIQRATNKGEALPVRIQAVRALAAIGDQQASGPLAQLLIVAPPPAPPRRPSASPPPVPAAPSSPVDRNLQFEIVSALGQLRDPRAVDLLLDIASDTWPALRASSLISLAQIDGEAFFTAISGLDPDPDWNVRAALATALGTLDIERAQAKLTVLAADADQRVLAAALDALVATKAPAASAMLLEKLRSDDFGVRRSAANGLATLKPPGAAEALVAAFDDSSERDSTYVARAAIMAALAAVDPEKARPVLMRGLSDKDWAIRLRAAELLRKVAPGEPAEPVRPAPPVPVPEVNALDRLIAPDVTPIAYLDTEAGVIEVELAVLDAPRTVASFVALAAKGFFNGTPIHRVVADFVVQDGDPRGDGEGGPGYTVRDEINQRPYLRGTVGMALDWADTGGSQFFITHSPQPHLDGRYTVFGQVRAGMEVVDRLTRGMVIRAIRVWDGNGWIGR